MLSLRFNSQCRCLRSILTRAVAVRHKSDKSGKPSETEAQSGSTAESSETSKLAKQKLNDLLSKIVEDSKITKTTSIPEQPRTPVAAEAENEKPKRQQAKVKKQKTDIPPPKEIKLGKRVMSAVKQVAERMGGDAEKVESELVQKLKSHSVIASKARLADILTGITVEPGKRREETLSSSRAQDVQQAMQSRRSRFPQRDDSRRERQPGGDFDSRSDGRQQQYYVLKPEDLFDAEPVGIFESATPRDNVAALSTWNKLYQKQMELSVTHPPANGFEEMILWTKQGKLWRFPVDNEQGMEEEAQYSFEDHVFLEPVIDEWCPPAGPLRQFMQIVCTGLSKNAYLTVQEKHEYLDWYHAYFKDKNTLLKEIGLGEVKEKTSRSQIAL